MTIEINEVYKFRYPNYGTPDMRPDYTRHSGELVLVLERVPTGDEGETGNLYKVKANDGWIGEAFESELERYCPCDRETTIDPLCAAAGECAR